MSFSNETELKPIYGLLKLLNMKVYSSLPTLFSEAYENDDEFVKQSDKNALFRQ